MPRILRFLPILSLFYADSRAKRMAILNDRQELVSAWIDFPTYG